MFKRHDAWRVGVSSIVSAATSLLSVLGFARYAATRTARTDGQIGPMEASKYGDLGVVAAEPKDHAAVTPNDATAVDFANGLYVGTGGTVVGRLKDSAASVTYSNVPSGAYLRGHWVRVDATGTTATNIVGLKD